MAKKAKKVNTIITIDLTNTADDMIILSDEVKEYLAEPITLKDIERIRYRLASPLQKAWLSLKRIF